MRNGAMGTVTVGWFENVLENWRCRRKKEKHKTASILR
jgi:hypothetical protein